VPWAQAGVLHVWISKRLFICRRTPSQGTFLDFTASFEPSCASQPVKCIRLGNTEKVFKSHANLQCHACVGVTCVGVTCVGGVNAELVAENLVARNQAHKILRRSVRINWCLHKGSSRRNEEWPYYQHHWLALPRCHVMSSCTRSDLNCSVFKLQKFNATRLQAQPTVCSVWRNRRGKSRCKRIETFEEPSCLQDLRDREIDWT
jgi:hypothetical protein